MDFSSIVVLGEHSDQGHHRKIVPYDQMPQIRRCALPFSAIVGCHLDREDVLPLAFVSLQFQADLTHSLAAFAGFDLV